MYIQSRELNIFLCEDEEEQLKQIESEICEIASRRKWRIRLECFSNGNKMLSEIKRRIEKKIPLPEILFLDIRLHGESGIEIGRKISAAAPEIYLIYLTAYEEYAIEGYETRAFRYLLKPLTEREFVSVMERIYRELGKEKNILIREENKETYLPVKNILYISAEDKYTVLHSLDGDFLKRNSLKYYEDRLKEYGFFRIHRKYLVNMKYHKSLGGGKVILTNNCILPISRRKEVLYRKEIFHALQEGLLR